MTTRAVLTLLLTASFVTCLPRNQSGAQTRDENQEDIRLVSVYSLADLPAWQVDEKGNSRFDASILISHIRANVAPASWEDNAAIVADDSRPPGLVVIQTRENHRLIERLLRRLSAFAGRDVADKLAENLRDAKTANQNVLLFVGDPNAQSTIEFFDLRYGTETGAHFDNFVVQCVPLTDREFLKAKNIETTGQPIVVVFSENGDLIDKAELDSLNKHESVDGKLLGAFLDSHRPILPDAEEQLQSAIARAEREKKRVLVQVGGPNCGPCIALSRYLAKHDELVSRDYVLVKLDVRMPHAEKVTNRLGKEFGGIPWMAILSESGEPLITSEGPEGNIAFPRTEEQKSHFRVMLESTSVHLSGKDIAVLLASLPESS